MLALSSLLISNSAALSQHLLKNIRMELSMLKIRVEEKCSIDLAQLSNFLKSQSETLRALKLEGIEYQEEEVNSSSEKEDQWTFSKLVDMELNSGSLSRFLCRLDYPELINLRLQHQEESELTRQMWNQNAPKLVWKGGEGGLRGQ